MRGISGIIGMIGIGELLIFGGVIGSIVAFILYLLTLQKALLACDKTNREMKPNSVFINLIPVINLFFHIYTVIKVSTSLYKELNSRNIDTKSKPGLVFGLIYCVSYVIFIIFCYMPKTDYFLWLIPFISLIVSWIIYWVIIRKSYKKIKE